MSLNNHSASMVIFRDYMIVVSGWDICLQHHAMQLVVQSSIFRTELYATTSSGMCPPLHAFNSCALSLFVFGILRADYVDVALAPNAL